MPAALHSRHRVRDAVLSSLYLIFSCSTAFAQGSVTATLRGTVTDPTGAVLPGVSVVIINSRTGDTRETTTDERGGYLVAGLFHSTYELRVELSGFKTFDRTNIVLSPSDARGIDIVLEV